MAATALVTGASGFVGRELCKALRDKGVSVRALLRAPCEGEWSEAVISELESVPASAMEGVRTVFHLAGKAHALAETRQAEAEYFRINTEGTRSLLEVAEATEVRRFVLFSSVKAMGEGGAACLDESVPCDPETPYGKSKLEAERLVLEGGYVPEPVVLRLSMVYGATHKGNLPRMIEAVARGRFPPLPEVNNRRSMVHVEDVVQAAILASESPAAVGNAYIVTDGQPYSTRQMYECICASLNKPVPGWNIPLGVMKLLASIGDGVGKIRRRRFVFDSDVLEKLTDSAWYSSEKMTRELGFHARRHLDDSLPGIAHFLECV